MVRSAFDHEKLDVYRLAIEHVAWVGLLLDGSVRTGRPGVYRHLDEASTSIALNIAEGNGKRSQLDRARFLDIARGSALESAACLDVLVARGQLTTEAIEPGKAMLIRIVSMLTRLTERMLARV